MFGRDIESRRLLFAKGALFVALGCLASAILLVRNPAIETVILLAIAIWAFARAYYFAFYVIEHYVDPGYRFAGLVDFMRYLRGRRRPPG